jgi:short-subunit dehydrogenase
MAEKSEQFALVTGSAKGIGRSIAQELAKRNYSLLLVDLDKKELDVTAEKLRSNYPDIEVKTFGFDLSKLDLYSELIEWTTPYHTRLDVLVNNAAFGLNGQFDQLALDEQLEMIDTNLKAPVVLTHLFIPILKGSKKKYILNVASTAAYQAVPYFTIYSATKAAVLSFNRAVRYELRNTNISLTTLSPGSTDTNFVHRARMGNSLKKLARKLNMSPDDVARIGLKGLFAGKSEIIPGFINVLNAYLPKFAPKALTEKVGANIYKPEDLQ